MSPRVDVALGSNLGDRAAQLSNAVGALSLLPATRVVALSRIEETVPFGRSAQGPYLNQMIAVHTGLEPFALLAALQRIEHRLGRQRRERWGARTIDLDIVRYGDHRIDTPRLALPHPGLRTREFWQRELLELDLLMARAA
jgi:2-amino-4-hydroxy-6-hydroxymethyldihydropteridine diphosphokinase